MADDIGITSARLIQVSDTSYIFEADIIQQAIWAIKAPVFPQRFTVSGMELTDKAGWIIARVTATTTGEPLDYKDEILLPWMRSGVSLTTQWNDGTLGRGFFRRSLDGIHIPMNVLMPIEKTDLEIGLESFILGIKHIGFGYIHLLLVLALFILFQGRKALFISLLWYAFGQGFSLILIEFGVSGFDILFTEMLILLLVLLISVSAARNTMSFNFVYWILLLVGLLHGLSAARELVVLNPGFNQEIIVVFMFDMAVDVVHFSFAVLLIPIFSILTNQKKAIRTTAYLAGVLSVALIIGIFNQKVLTGDTNVVELQETEDVTQSALPTNQASQSSANRPQGAIQLTTPVMSYLSIEPFEVRHELLVNAGTALELIGAQDRSMGSIPEASQEGIKQRTLDLFEKSNRILIDGAEVAPILTLIDFVTLGPTGVFIRSEPVRESLEEGIIGITLIYETETLAKNISIIWDLV